MLSPPSTSGKKSICAILYMTALVHFISRGMRTYYYLTESGVHGDDLFHTSSNLQKRWPSEDGPTNHDPLAQQTQEPDYHRQAQCVVYSCSRVKD
jgi:predicted HAD superfamily Cof-like phosphohydrolase